MDALNMLLVGCGMMGARHVRGIGELQGVAPEAIRLAAVCDVRREAAEKVADEAEQLLGERPGVFSDVEAAVSRTPDLEAVDLVTEPRSHDDLTVGLLEAGLHVLCEKPLALTIRRGLRMIEAAEAAGRVLATAENNRRDPMNRLARACIDGGLIGTPNFILQLLINPGGRIIATAWRHRLAMGGVLLDVAIHTAYEIEALVGEVETIAGQAQLVQTDRCGKEYDGTEVAVEADAEDCFSAVLGLANGCRGQWTGHFASPGETMFKRLVVGSEGTLSCPSSRSGRPVEVRRGEELLTGDTLLAELLDYSLNPIETALFGERPSSYQLEPVVTDRKLIAAELHDFAEAVRTDRAPESDGRTGLRAVGLIYGVLESSLAGRTVAVAEVLDGSLHAYEDRVEAARGEGRGARG